jgi:hypothetical protein
MPTSVPAPTDSFPPPTSAADVLAPTFLAPTVWRRHPGADFLAPTFWRRLPGADFLAPTFWRRLPGADVLAPTSWRRHGGGRPHRLERRSCHDDGMRRCRTGLTGVRSCGRAVLLCLLAVLLSGCVKLNANLRIGTDDTVTGDYVVAYQKDPKRPAAGLQTVRELLVSRGTATATKYDDGRYAGWTYHLRGVPVGDLAEFAAVAYENRQTGTIEISRSGDEFVVDGMFDFRETHPVNRTPEQQREASRGFQVRITLTFPGDVVDANGLIDGRTVTWQPQPFALSRLQARAAAVPPAPPPVRERSVLPAYFLAAGIVLGGLTAVLALVALLRRLLARREVSQLAPAEAIGADPSDFSWVVGEPPEPRRTTRPGPPDRPERESPPGPGGPQPDQEVWQRPVEPWYGSGHPPWTYPPPSPYPPPFPYRPPFPAPGAEPGPPFQPGSPAPWLPDGAGWSGTAPADPDAAPWAASTGPGPGPGPGPSPGAGSPSGPVPAVPPGAPEEPSTAGSGHNDVPAPRGDGAPAPGAASGNDRPDDRQPHVR